MYVVCESWYLRMGCGLGYTASTLCRLATDDNERGVLPQWPRIHRMWQTCHLHVIGYIHVDSCCIILLCFGCWFGYILLSISMSHTLLVFLYGLPDNRWLRGGPLPVNVWGVQLVSSDFWTCCRLVLLMICNKRVFWAHVLFKLFFFSRRLLEFETVVSVGTFIFM